MTGVRLQQHCQPLVVHGRAGQRVADVGGHVVVTEAHRVGVAERPRTHLGAGPHPDAGERAQPPVEHLGRLAARSLERGRDPGSVLDRARPGTVDGQPQPLPGRDRPQVGGRGLQPELHRRFPLAGGSGRTFAEAVHEGAERTERLLAGHLLLDDRRHERLHHEVGRPEAPVGVPPPGQLDRLVDRHEAGGVVVGPQHPGQLRQDPLGAVPPRLTGDLPRRRVGHDPQRRAALGCPDAPPDGPVGGTPECRVTGSTAMRRQDLADRARPVRPPDPDERSCMGGHLRRL